MILPNEAKKKTEKAIHRKEVEKELSLAIEMAAEMGSNCTMFTNLTSEECNYRDRILTHYGYHTVVTSRDKKNDNYNLECEW